MSRQCFSQGLQLLLRALPGGVKLLQRAVLWLLTLPAHDVAHALEAPLEAVGSPVERGGGVGKKEAGEIHNGKEQIPQLILGVLMIARVARLVDFVDFLVDFLKDTGDLRPVESKGSGIALDSAGA